MCLISGYSICVSKCSQPYFPAIVCLLSDLQSQFASLLLLKVLGARRQFWIYICFLFMRLFIYTLTFYFTISYFSKFNLWFLVNILSSTVHTHVNTSKSCAGIRCQLHKTQLKLTAPNVASNTADRWV